MKVLVPVTGAEGDRFHSFNKEVTGSVVIDSKNLLNVLKLTLSDGTIICYVRRIT